MRVCRLPCTGWARSRQTGVDLEPLWSENWGERSSLVEVEVEVAKLVMC